MATTAGRRSGTRQRILETCRELFNRRGTADITTAEIAAAVGINEGNLYYHFKRKEQILETLFAAFAAELREVAAADLVEGEAETRAARYFRGWFGLMWEWRFFYRDAMVVRRLAPGLQAELERLADEGQADLRRALRSMAANGLIVADDDELERMMVNAWIVATYWIDYLRMRHGVGDITRRHLDWGAWQLMGIFDPYLTAEGRRLLAAAGGVRPGPVPEVQA